MAADDSGIKGHLPQRLLDYWAHGKGLARWSESPKPYTALVAALREEGIPGRMIHGLAANIFKAAKGQYPGQRGDAKHEHSGRH